MVTDLAEVCGQEVARRALEVAAAGGHSLLLIGPSGAGKSMLARCLPGLLPPAEADAPRPARVPGRAGRILSRPSGQVQPAGGQRRGHPGSQRDLRRCSLHLSGERGLVTSLIYADGFVNGFGEWIVVGGS